MLIMVFEEASSKKERNEECFINCLPRELIERIFFRLPVSTLLVCVGVCMHWKTLIRDPNFVTSHLKDASHYSLIFFQQDYVAGKYYPSDAILIDKAWSQSRYAVPTIDPDDFLCGSCNGIICLYTKTSTIKIANLATGECLHLAKPIKNLSGDQFLFYSFGFHPLTREYKITHLVGDYVEGRPQYGDKFSIIQIYRLGDEKWKDVRTPEALSLRCVKNSGLINVGGTMYWLTNDIAASWKHVVMCFDLGEESFARIQLPTSVPENCVHGGPRKYWIREIDGEICIATAQTWHKVVYGKLQIWTFDNKVEQTWSLKYNIHVAGYIAGPNLAYADKLLMQRNDSRLFSHEFGNGGDMKTMILNMAGLLDFSPVLDFSPRKPENMQSYIYVESLVRLDVYKKGGIVRRPKKREGWKLKKWKSWEHDLSQLEEMWSHIHQKEHHITVFSQRTGIQLNHRLHGISNDVIRQQIGLKIDQIVPVFPNKYPRSPRRFNLVGQERDKEKLLARMKKYGDICGALDEKIWRIVHMTESTIQYQVGTSSANDVISSQNHSHGEDAVESWEHIMTIFLA